MAAGEGEHGGREDGGRGVASDNGWHQMTSPSHHMQHDSRSHQQTVLPPPHFFYSLSVGMCAVVVVVVVVFLLFSPQI